LIRGFRHGFASITLVFALDSGKKIQMFCKSINYGRTRSRGLVRGNHPDPIAKTRGENEYKCSVEMALAEYRLLVAEIGPGYGDLFFDTLVTYGEDGFTTVTDTILGCTIDDDDASNSQGPDPLMRKLDLAPLKILMAGVDDLEVPMVSPP
jgi:hypothetical protein